jgi:hypothetical protein
MKLNIKNVVPVTNHWNIYINENDQTEVFSPVSALALISDSDGQEFWKYIDTLDIERQFDTQNDGDLTYMNTIYSEKEPSFLQ